MAENPTPNPNESFSKDFNDRITKQILDPYNFVTSKSVFDYRSDSVRNDRYKAIEGQDDEFMTYIKKIYGDYETYLRKSKIKRDVNIFDPSVDFIIDVSVVKKDNVYKTDHISAAEVIMENLSGVCSIWFLKKNGNTRRLNCTLSSLSIPSGEFDTRNKFFSPMPNARVGVWDLNEQKWKSFYMGNVFRFVRDDSESLE
jgi:hypothetical protein